MELLLLIISEPLAGPQTKRWRRGMSGLQGDAFWSFVLTRVIIPLKLSTGCKVLADIYIYIYILHCIIVHQYVIICNVGIEKEEQGGCILVFLLIRAMQDEVDPTVI